MKTSLLAPLSLAVVASILFSFAPARAQDPGVGNVLPVITLHTPDAHASEAGDNPGRFVLGRQGPTNVALHVFLRIGGTATNGVDYAAIPNWIPIPAGVREVPIPVLPLPDNETEGPETVVAQILPPPAVAPAPYAVGTPSEGVVTIYEQNAPPPPQSPVVTVRAVDPEAVEPAGPGLPANVGVFRLRREGSTNDQLNVHYELRGDASNGVDYVQLSGVAVVPAGQREADVVVVPRHDTLAEGVERVVLRLADVFWIAIYPPPPGFYSVGVPREAAVFIADNDQPTNRPPVVRIVKPFDGQVFLAPPRLPIAVETVDPDGWVPRVEFFANGNLLGVRERMFITPPPPGERIGYEFVWTNPPVGRHVLTARATDNRGAQSWSAPVRIWVAATNPPPPVGVSIIARDAVAAEGTNCLAWPGVTNPPAGSNACLINTALFVVRRTGPTNEPLAVRYLVGGTASNGVDYLELTGVVTIPAGRRAAEIRVVPVDDALPEPNETVILSLRLPPETTAVIPPYVPAWPARAAAVIVDNDRPRPPVGVLEDRVFHLALAGENGRWYRIECSPDGRHWQSIGSVPVTEGALHFVDPEADEAPARLYRAVPVETPPED
jgi:hypothetical protein